MNVRRRQCKACPWKVSTVPDRDIPGGYCEAKHAALESTIATPGDASTLAAGSLRLMACHESPPGAEQPCVGWVLHQLGPGNNIPLRVLALDGRFNGLEADGPQHETFEDTLPRGGDDCGLTKRQTRRTTKRDTMKTRKTTAPATPSAEPIPAPVAENRPTPPPPPPPKERGGRRPGAGRKPVMGEAMDQGIYLRCSLSQKEALTAYVEKISNEREAQGLPRIDLSTWIRELALKHSGNENLGLAAQARRRAEAIESIV